ncbi:helicase domain protein [Nitzschia inconspicua]|uniref:Helicase domain protein n=1 Tax=Nitzschia inconspicua TaxID=303405 RepID=A0A9K3L2P5_9STRA|nr:helicase domain protein [Nitzschia inconspicua]
MKHSHPLMPRPASKKSDQFCASEGSSLSDLFLSMDDEPLDLDEAILAPMAIRSLSKELFLAPEKHLPDTNDSSSAPIRFRKYQTSQWDDRFQELLLFQQEHGHLLVPHSYPPNQKLAQWVKRQRHQFKRKKLGHHSTLTDEREQQLLEVGFIFDSHRAVWHARFETLKAFRLANGHCGIPAKYEDGSLNVWIKHQRRQYLLFINGEKSTMTEERIAALNSIGFNWNPRNFARPNKV